MFDRAAPLRPRRHSIRREVASAKAARLRRADDGDWKLFMLSFGAFFVCFYTFIA